MVEMAQAFGNGSPAYQKLLAANGGNVDAMNQMINKNLAGFQGGQTSRATPADWGWKWANGQWQPPASGNMGQTWDAATQRFK
jgi:hypothetical protein